MNCAEVEDLLGPYVDEDLAVEVRSRVEAHLLTCRACAWEAQSLTITRSRLREGLGEITASDAFRSRALSRILVDNPHVAPTAPTAEEPTQYQLPIRL